MNSYNMIRIGSTITGSLMFAMGVSFLAEAIYGATPPPKPGYVVKLPEATAPAGEGAKPAEAAPAEPIALRLAKADATAGTVAAAKACIACHSFRLGEAAKAGPNLYGIVGGQVGQAAGYDYSPALRAKKAAAEQWDFAALDQFLTAPQKVVPGTKMSFPGLPDPAARANVIAYLRSLSGNPVPLPTP